MHVLKYVQGIPIDVNPYRQDDPHYIKYSGDRIATWMFYVSSCPWKVKQSKLFP